MGVFFGFSLELELSGELVLSLLQFLSVPHVLVVNVLDLRFDALELGIQLGGERGRERERQTERVRRREVAQCSAVQSLMNWSPTSCSLVARSNSNGGTGVWRNGQPIGAQQHGSPPSSSLLHS